jgi:RNase P/RNase MRP subunit p29
VGIVVGETHNIVYIDTGLKIVKIPKALCYFYIYDLQKLVHGSRLLGYRDRRLFNC